MRRLLRQVRRLLFFGGVTALSWAALLAALLVARVFRRDVVRLRANAVSAWSRRVLPILGIELTIEGPVPTPPFVLVTNHLGYLDVPVLASQAPLAFVGKAEIANWPIFGPLARSTGTIFIDRDRVRDIPRVVADIEAAFAGGIGVAIFPEATSSAGAEVLRFRPSLLEGAARTGLPVVYAALRYRTPPGEVPAHVSVCWWDDTNMLRHVGRLFGLSRIEARIRFGTERVLAEDRKELAERLHRHVSQLFEPLVAPSAK